MKAAKGSGKAGGKAKGKTQARKRSTGTTEVKKKRPGAGEAVEGPVKPARRVRDREEPVKPRRPRTTDSREPLVKRKDSGRSEEERREKSPRGEERGARISRNRPERSGTGRERPAFDRDERRGERRERPSYDRGERPGDRRERSSYGRDERKGERGERAPFRTSGNQADRRERSPRENERDGGSSYRSFGKRKEDGGVEKSRPGVRQRAGGKRQEPGGEPRRKPGSNEIRLNKYIADSGMCSRREADKLIESGAVRVNGEVITLLGSKVLPTDKVQVGDQTLSRETLRYVLLNKPKGFITTMDDPEGRKTVMTLVREACRERIYPVGRLDRNTTGLLLLTNDGEMTKKLTHPKHGIRKVYHVVLDQPISGEDLARVEEGIELEDGFIRVDAIAVTGDGKDRRQLGVEIHSGKNRIIRRIFEQLGYTISKLDRVVFAGLTKKDLARGQWRNLTPQEISFLKMLG